MTIEPTGIVFTDPPEVRHAIALRNVPKVVHQLAPLRSRPGEWARVYGPLPAESAKNKARSIRRGAHVGVPEGEYEAVSRTLDDGTYVWVRYIGHHTNGDTP